MATETNSQAVQDTSAQQQTPTDRPAKVTFDAAQQAKVDEIIREKQGEAARAVRAELADTQAALSAVRAEFDAYKKRGKEPSPELEALHHEYRQYQQTAEQREQQLRTQLADIRRDQALSKELGKHNFVSPETVQQLIRDHVQLADDGRLTVRTETGTTRLNSALEPMSLSEYVAEFAGKNSWMLRGEVKGGAGSAEAGHTPGSTGYPLERIFGPASDGRLAQQLYRRSPAEYRRLRAQAVERGLLS